MPAAPLGAWTAPALRGSGGPPRSRIGGAGALATGVCRPPTEVPLNRAGGCLTLTLTLTPRALGQAQRHRWLAGQRVAKRRSDWSWSRVEGAAPLSSAVPQSVVSVLPQAFTESREDVRWVSRGQPGGSHRPVSPDTSTGPISPQCLGRLQPAFECPHSPTPPLAPCGQPVGRLLRTPPPPDSR